MDKMITTGKSPDVLVTELWFDAVTSNDNDIVTTIQTILANNPSIVDQYRSGKETTISFFVGQVMMALAGKIDPNKAKQLLEVELCKDAS